MQLAEQRFLNIPISALIFSFALHFLFGIMFLGMKGFDKGIFSFDKKADKKEIYQSFIQVDMIGLPQEIGQEKSSMDTSLPIVEKTKTQVKEEDIAEEKEDSMELESEKLKEEAKKEKQAKEERSLKLAKDKRAKEQEKAMKKLQAEAKREQALKALQPKSGKIGRGKISGNLLSQGNALSGAIGTAKDKYSGQIVNVIKSHFNIFLWQNKKQLTAEVHIELFLNGKIKSRKITKASADPLYDSSVLQAVDQSDPFPLPEDLTLLDGGIDVNFTP